MLLLDCIDWIVDMYCVVCVYCVVEVEVVVCWIMVGCDWYVGVGWGDWFWVVDLYIWFVEVFDIWNWCGCLCKVEVKCVEFCVEGCVEYGGCVVGSDGYVVVVG